MQKGFWLERNDIKEIYPYLNKNIDCDVVVIGGGINGAITAYILAKEGFDVVVLEKNIVGYKNSGISSGCITDFLDEMYIKTGSKTDENILKRYSNLRTKARKIFNLMIKDLETSYEVANYMFLDTRLFQKKSLKNEMKIRNILGEESQFLDRQDNINSNTILEVKRGAYMIDSYMLTQNIFEYLREKDNVRIYENTCMKSFESALENITIFTQNNFKVKAKSCIITTPTECLDFVTGNPNIELNKRFSLVTNNAFKENLCAKILNDIPLYIRNSKDILVISGIDTKYISKMENIKYLESLKEENKRKIENTLLKLFPNFEITQSNIYCANILKTNDMLPIISELDEVPNAYLNVGSGSSSLMQALIGADILKDAIRGYYPKEMNLFKLKRN